MSDPDKALLGAVLSGYRDIDKLSTIVFPTSFREPRHETIWSAIIAVHEAGNRPDATTVQMALKPADMREWDPTYLVDLMQACPQVANAPLYAQQVADEATRRNIAGAGRYVADLAEQVEDMADLRERARFAIEQATATREVRTAHRVGDVLPTVLDIAENGRAKMLSTGWPDVDRIIGGLAPGRVIVVGGRPGAGKSLVGTNLALHVAHRYNHAALVCSMEMPEVEVGQRILASHARVNLSSLSKGETDARDWDRISRYQAEVTDLPIIIDDSADQTLTSIRTAIRDIKATRDDLALVVVDYLQLMRPPDTRVGRVEQIGALSRGLKLMAREHDTCVVAMAQLNRAPAVPARRPTMADLRESGSIEADADLVALLHQPDDDIPEVELIVDKHRNGPKGIARLAVMGHYATLGSIDGESWRKPA